MNVVLAARAPASAARGEFFNPILASRETACRIDVWARFVVDAPAASCPEHSVVSSLDRIRRQQLVAQAEGYLELGMARHALDVLARCGDSSAFSDHALYLQGECLRAVGRFAEAIESLARSAAGTPSNVHVWLALGWCHKRTDRIDLAIEALEEALAAEPHDALVHYNLACYWALAGKKRQALAYLTRAFDLKDQYRGLVADEPDFDSIRGDPTFQSLVRVTV
jgi:tetratricopeptide (TPR) repeat protein